MKNFIKKAVAGILTAAIAAMNFVPAFTVSAEESQTLKVHNLVLFAQFPNEDANYNFMSDKTEKMLEFCEAENTTRSFKGYINEISYGQMNVDFVFPQLEDNLITPYTMKKSQSEYTNAELMITELVSNAKIPENAELDGNNDGVADNIIVVFDSDSKSASSIFWPRAISLPGIDLNGTISGIKLSDITINDDKLSFKVDFADLTDFDTWKSMPVPDDSVSADSLDIEASNNTPYLLTDTKNGTAVFSYENDEWKAYTTELPEKAYNAKLIMNGNTPYVLYNDSQFFFTIRYYKDGNWKFLLKGSEVNQYQDFCIYDNKIYLAYTTGSFPYQLHLLSYDLLTGDSENYVNDSGDVCNISIAANKNGVAVSYRGTEDTSPFVDIWKSRTEKETIKLSDENSGITKIVSDENKFYVTSTEKSAGLYTIENSKSEKTDFSGINGNIFFAEPFMCENDLYVTLNTQNPDDLSVYKVVNNKLEKVRNSILSETVNNSVSCAGQNAIYTAYISLSGNIAIKKIDLKNSSENIIGDVNKDSIFNIADIVTLQKYILNQEISIFDYKSADINNDNKINVIDLALLKEKISE